MLLRPLLELARAEDLGPPGGPGDITSAVTCPPDAEGQARLIARAPGVFAGVAVIPTLVEVFCPDGRVSVETFVADGQRITRGETLALFRGRLRDILALERTLLNLLGRLSGIATRTARFVELVAGARAAILDTRKTTPGLRELEKYAVRCGGGQNHRAGLYDALLIKDNHLAGLPLDRLAPFVADAAARARAIAAAHNQPLAFVECEVDHLDQLDALLDPQWRGCGVDIILLDNMPPDTLREAVARRDRSGLPIALEASGGIDETTVRAVAETGVDRISIGGLTHQATTLDLALDM